MEKIILQLSVFAIIGVIMFSVASFLPAHAIMGGNNMENDFMKYTHMMGNMTKEYVKLLSPLEQYKHGSLPVDVKCNGSFSLVLKASDRSPACVKSSSVKTLIERGWAKGDSMRKMTGTNTIQNKASMTFHIIMNNPIMQGNLTSREASSMPHSSVDESKYASAPTLVGISDYINTTPSKLAQEVKGKIVVYDFWTFNCINCIHTLPHVVDLSNKYLEKGLLVIGVHSPETIFEKDPNNVRDAVHRYNIQYPVVIDNEFQTWNAFGNHYWPHIYIADAQGKIRYDHIGEGAYDEIDNTVASLILEKENQKPKELAMG
jgi:thiol-disulfide isomerase/thioredoxin